MSQSPKQKILLVDDHGDTGKVFQMLLERQGYFVKTAMSFHGALEAADKDEFDLLVSDIGLPDGNGLDLIKQISEKRPIKGIALSGFGMQEDVERSIEAGFSEHLTKPVSFQTLKDAVVKVLAQG